MLSKLLALTPTQANNGQNSSHQNKTDILGQSTEEVLPAAAQFCFEVTDGATAPAVDDSASATASRASGTASSDATGTPAPSQSGSSDESTTTASPDGAAAMGSIGGVGMMILGLLAAF